MANVKIKHLAKDQTWHDANATWVVDVGRIVILLGSNPLRFKIGDGTTQLQNLVWQNLTTSTLAQILANDNKTNNIIITSNNGASEIHAHDTEAALIYTFTGGFNTLLQNDLEFTLTRSSGATFNTLHLEDLYSLLSYSSGTKAGYFKSEETQSEIFHDDLINFTAPSVMLNGVAVATQSFVHAIIQSNIKIIGDWDATSGSYPLADESNTTPFISQWGSTIKAGWAFRVGYGQAGTVGGYDYENGDVVYALIDNPTDVALDWGDLDHNLQQATESTRGTAKIATNAIVDDETTTDNERIVTPYKLWGRFVTRFLQLAWTWAAKQTFTSAPKFNSTTVNQRLEVDSNKELISVAKGTADNKDFGTTAGTVAEGNDVRFTNSRGRKYFAYDNTSFSYTGTTSNTIVKTIEINVGDMLENSTLSLMMNFFKIGTNNTFSMFLYITTNPSAATGGTQIGANGTGATASLQFGKHYRLTNKNSLTNQLGQTSGNNADDFSTILNGAKQVLNIDFTVKQYLHIVMKANSTLDTVGISDYQAYIDNP